MVNAVLIFVVLLQGERDTFNRTLEEEKKKSSQIKRKLKGLDLKDDEIATLQKELGELQVGTVITLCVLTLTVL